MDIFATPLCYLPQVAGSMERVEFCGNELARVDSDGGINKEECLSGNSNTFRKIERDISKFLTHQNSTVPETTDDIEEENEPPRVTQLTEAHKNAIRAIRRIKYLTARRKFQQARKPYDVRDVIEQYSQGHLNMMVRIKELQRRLDQTLGKPGSYLVGIDNMGTRKPTTVGVRLYRVEQQLFNLDRKMDVITGLLMKIEQNHEQQGAVEEDDTAQ